MSKFKIGDIIFDEHYSKTFLVIDEVESNNRVHNNSSARHAYLRIFSLVDRIDVNKIIVELKST